MFSDQECSGNAKDPILLLETHTRFSVLKTRHSLVLMNPAYFPGTDSHFLAVSQPRTGVGLGAQVEPVLWLNRQGCFLCLVSVETPSCVFRGEFSWDDFLIYIL